MDFGDGLHVEGWALTGPGDKLAHGIVQAPALLRDDNVAAVHSITIPGRQRLSDMESRVTDDRLDQRRG